jgi:3-hydroxyisobutyrate dehydrogenase-like beta-hydroxyacid dehydrogenase
MGTRVGFVGLGTMGSRIAAHLARAGHELVVFNRTRLRAHDFAAQYGARAVDTPGDVAAGAAVVICCVGHDEHLAQVLLSDDGVLAAMPTGGVIVDHTTASARFARELARVALGRGIGFIDAPVSGGEVGAEQGTLTVMAGGRAEDFERVRTLIEHYARTVRLLGPTGSGQLTKMVNQLCIAGILQGLAEGLHFAEQAGLDPHAVVEVIAKGAAQSWQMEQRHDSMIRGDYDFGFAVDWMRKDLGLALEEARFNGAKLPLAALVDQFYADLQAAGGQRWDTSSLIERLRPRTLP